MAGLVDRWGGEREGGAAAARGVEGEGLVERDDVAREGRVPRLGCAVGGRRRVAARRHGPAVLLGFGWGFFGGRRRGRPKTGERMPCFGLLALLVFEFCLMLLFGGVGLAVSGACFV